MLKKCTAYFVVISAVMFVIVPSQEQVFSDQKNSFQNPTNETLGLPDFQNTASDDGTSLGMSSVYIYPSVQLTKTGELNQQHLSRPVIPSMAFALPQSAPVVNITENIGFSPSPKLAINDGSSPETSSAARHSSSLLPNTTDPAIIRMAHAIAQPLMESKVFKNFVNFTLYKPYLLFYELRYEILLRSGITDDSLARLVAEAVNKAGVVNTFVWFHAVGFTIAELLFSKGLLTLDIASTYPQQILILSESYAYKHGVYDTKSLFECISNGCYDFLNSLGLINLSDLSQMHHSFARYIVDLALCCSDM